MEYQQELEFAKTLAYEAGDVMRRYFQADDIDVQFKEDTTPITIADTTINQMVIDRVREQYPDCGVIGEEGSFETDRSKLWIVDPIDGTKPYSMGIPVSTFCLAYVVDGQVLASVVNDPFQRRLYSATRGGGAYVNDTPIHVSDHPTTEGGSFMIGGRNLNELVVELRKGANAYELYSYSYGAMQVASGIFVAAGMEYGSPWDAAAASLIVQEAGGVVTDLNGNTRNYSEWGEGILATNSLVHDNLVRVLSNR